MPAATSITTFELQRIHLWLIWPRTSTCQILMETRTAVSPFILVDDIRCITSVTARFRALLMTGSVVLKGTVFDEWHRSRLVPYKHFVPFDLGSLPDLWHKLCFFIGGCCRGDGCENHERHAEAIGVGAAIWSRRVLRKADMELYWLRLLLEYARVVDERRHVLCERNDM